MTMIFCIFPLSLISSVRRRILRPAASLWCHVHRGETTDPTIIVIITIIITRPKPAYGRQGLAGSWGQDTDEVRTFVVFLTSHFAPAALSSNLINLGPLMTMKIHLETLKNHGNQPKTIKKHETTLKNHRNQPKPMKPP